MTWYTASVVIAVRLKSGTQNRVPIFENCYLIEAPTREEAFRRAEDIGKARRGRR